MLYPPSSESEYPQPILASLAGVVSRRKMRLIAAGCCRRILHLWPDARGKRGIETAEQYADRNLTRRQLEGVHVELVRAIRELVLAANSLAASATVYAARSVVWLTHPTKVRYAGSVADSSAAAMAYFAEAEYARTRDGSPEFAFRWAESHSAERAAQMRLIRDVLRDPKAPLSSIDPLWLTWQDGIVARMAREIYQDRTFEQLPILADALEDAGCTDSELLAHCRAPGPHTRGCWVLDLLLGLM